MQRFEDYIPVYPDQDDSNFQTKFTAKKEFNELASNVREDPPKRGEYYRHQKLAIRYLRIYDRLVNISSAGSGKSRFFIAAVEFIKQNPTIYKRVYVLEKGNLVLKEFQKQIVCGSPQNEYESELVKNSQFDSSRKANITREISKWYSLTTYKSFVNQVIKTKKHSKMTDAEIKENFSGCIFLLDEVHNITNTGTNRDHSIESSEEDIRKNKENMLIYNTMWRIFHIAERTKIIVASATPMINVPNEMPRVMNLLLPADMQMPNWDYKKVTLSQLEPYLRGKITFVRGLDTGVVANYMGNLMPEPHLIQVPNEEEIKETGWNGSFNYSNPGIQPIPPMKTIEVQTQVKIYTSEITGETQRKGYLHAMKVKNISRKKKNNSTEESTQFRDAEIQASSFVFPDGSYGGSFKRIPHVSKEKKHLFRTESGLSKYITSDRKDEFSAKSGFNEMLKIENLREYSCKFATIISIEMEHRDSKFENGPGSCFIYSKGLTGGGAILLAQCFSENGFSRYQSSSSAFDKSDPIEYSMCSNSSFSSLKKGITKAPRYALLTSETLDNDNKTNAILELFNSEENVFGEYIQVIIGTQISRDGINFSNCVRFHLCTADWNPSGTYQAISRTIRSTSHVFLLSLIRKKYEEQYPGMDSSNLTVNIDIYRHAAVLNDYENDTYYSVDLDFYKSSEEKDIYIHRIFRMLKQATFDCQINYQRNRRPDDIDGSPICDYQKCDYQCTGVKPTKMDYSTYDILYADELIKMCTKELIELLQEKGSITIEELIKKWVVRGIYREKFIYMTIDKIMLEKVQLLDRFGFICYLYINGSTIYIKREFPNGININQISQSSIYTKQLIVSKTTTFEQLIYEGQFDDQFEILENMKKLNVTEENSEEFLNLLNKLTVNFKVKLLEDSLLNLIEKKDTLADRIVFDQLQTSVFQTPEPEEDIINSSQFLGKNLKYPKGFKFKGVTNQNAESILIHTLYGTEQKENNYSTSKAFTNATGKIRILKRSENLGWRDATEYELPVYNNIIKEILKVRLEPFEQYPIYGLILSDNIFRIRDRTTETAIIEDNRNIKRGEVCSSIKKDRLIEILFKEKIMVPEVDNIVVRFSDNRNDMINYLKTKGYINENNFNQYSNEDLIFLCKWFMSKKKISNICTIVQQYFDRTGKLLVT